MLSEFVTLDGQAEVLPLASNARMPWPSAIILAALFVVAGTLVAALSSKLARGSIGPNPTTGLRLGSTLRSEEAWHAGQKAFAPFGIAGGVGTAALGAGLLFRPHQGLAITIASAAAIWLVVLPAVGAFMGDLAAKDA